jgi:hypothetical protein
LTDQTIKSPLQAAERDLVALGIATGALILLVGTGGSVLPKTLRALLDGTNRPDVLFVNALLLNIALIIFGWRGRQRLPRLPMITTSRAMPSRCAKAFCAPEPRRACGQGWTQRARVHRCTGSDCNHPLHQDARARQ